MSTDAIETKKIGRYKIEIFYDEDPPDPREWDNLGSMVCFHSRYSLGDKHDMSVNELKATVRRKDVISLPLYLYDHSGITMNTTGFSCPWDSGQVGYIYVEKSKVRKEYGCKRVSKKMLQRIKGYLRNEVENYDQYITGDVYGFRITKGKNEIDACWGISGMDYCMEEAEAIVRHMQKK